MASQQNKSTVEEIRARFDADVERFSDLEGGQAATIDAPLAMELVAKVAAGLIARTRVSQAVSHAPHVVDVGCGAGNYTLKLLENAPDCDCTLIDLSEPMLARAAQRVSASTRGSISTLQADIREVKLQPSSCDIVLAAAVLHHLRGDEEWHAVFANFYQALRPGGSIWIVDLVEHSTRSVQEIMWHRYGDYLTNMKDEAYRDAVFSYIEKEDTPRPLLFQLDCLRAAGFAEVEILHKNSVFAAFGAIK